MAKNLTRMLAPSMVLAAAAGTGCSVSRSSPDFLSSDPTPSVAATAAKNAQTGALRFTITDDTGSPLPARLTFLSMTGDRPELFDNPQADPDDLAVRGNVLYSLSGSNRVTVPVGEYRVIVSRGMEYSAPSYEVTIDPARPASIDAVLSREIDTSGWIGGDYHMHTLTHSGHGDSNMPERVISLAGEGVEFAVATDHNHNTDYRPTMRELGAEDAFTAVTGNEVSTPAGHFNAFPLDPDRETLPHLGTSAVPLFRLIRDEPNAWDITPVIQINHPRWGDINYFGQAGLDQVFGTTDSDVWSADFDTIEILNENEGWGYFDADETEHAVSDNAGSVLRDWFTLVNRGHRAAAVGNSDSHDVASVLAGVPRNYTPSSTDTPAEIDPAEVAAMLRARRVFTTTGPFVEFTVQGAGMGETVRAGVGQRGGRPEVEAEITVQAASWIGVERIKVVVNGDIVETIPVEPSTASVRFDGRVAVALPRTTDAWVSLLVEGDTPMSPVLHDQDRPILPLAVTNPVFVDSDGDGEWTPPAQAAGELAAKLNSVGESSTAIAVASWRTLTPSERALLLHDATVNGYPFASTLAEKGLEHPDRFVRLTAARAAFELADPTLERAIREAGRSHPEDERFQGLLMRAFEKITGVELSD